MDVGQWTLDFQEFLKRCVSGVSVPLKNLRHCRQWEFPNAWVRSD